MALTAKEVRGARAPSPHLTSPCPSWSAISGLRRARHRGAAVAPDAALFDLSQRVGGRDGLFVSLGSPAGVVIVHEMSLCASVVEILENQARVQDYSRVKTVWLEVGELAGVELEALRFGFDVVTRGTLADGAALEIAEVPGAAWCLPCARTVSTRRRLDPCPRCGGHQLRITGGEELRVRELEVE